MNRKLPWLLIIAALGLLMLSTPLTAQKGKPKKVELNEEEKAALRQECMSRLVMANELYAEGKKRDMPELLISAASILRSVSQYPEMNNPAISDVKPEIKGEGTALDEVVAKPRTLRDQSDAIFEEASRRFDDPIALDKIIATIKKREEEIEKKEQRAVFGGPKQIARLIAPGQTHSFDFKLINNAPAPFMFEGSIPLHISIVRTDDKNAWFAGQTNMLARTFHPRYNPKAVIAPITIRIHNPTGKKAMYQFMLL